MGGLPSRSLLTMNRPHFLKHSALALAVFVLLLVIGSSRLLSGTIPPQRLWAVAAILIVFSYAGAAAIDWASRRDERKNSQD